MPPMRRKPPPRDRKLDSAGVRLSGADRARAAGTVVERTQSPAVDLGRTARRLREGQNLTLADVARRARINSAMLGRLGDRRVSPRLGNLFSFSQALGATPSAVMQ